MKDALALALVHFFWQGAVLAVVAGVLMRLAKAPSVRYAIGVATMAAMLAAPALTFLVLSADGAAGQATTVQAVGERSNEGASIASTESTSALAGGPVGGAYRPESRPSGVILPTTWILSFWALGVVLLSLRVAGGWAVAHRLATGTLTPVRDDLQLLAARIAGRLNVHGVVRVCESASVAVPIMVGWLKPVIVMPPAALAALPVAQLEALLAHEFAHIRRHDYLVNLLQIGVETLCFYHPGVWWVSREVRRHREHCCDDVAVGVCDRLTYVTALSTLASISTPQVALAATGGSLRDRVRRIVEPTTHTATTKGAWMAMLPVLLVVSIVAPHAWGDQFAASAPPAATPTANVAQAAVTAEEAKPVPSIAAPVPVQVRPQTTARPSVRIVTPRPARTARVTIERPSAVQPRTPPGARATTRVDSRSEQEARAEIAARRIELEHQAGLVDSQHELAALEAKLRQQETALARTRRLVETGLASQETLTAAEAQIVETRLQLETAARRLDLRQQEVRLSRSEAELERSTIAREVVSTERRLATLDPDAALQPQDQLTIVIAGEPDLPRLFTVRVDGSIRFPFLGTIRVQDSTTAQVQSAIQKLITDKGLARNPAVTVSARRGR